MCYNIIIMEGNKKNKPRALLVFGAPCSGKSTFSEKFAKKFGLAFYDLSKLSESGFSHEQIITVLKLILRTRQTIIIEGCLNTEAERVEMRNLLRADGYEPALIWIQTDITTIRNRLKQRHRSVSKAKQAYDGAVNDMEAPAENERPIILSGKHTFETQTKHVITGLADLVEAK